nr:unnamed protein product [Callosobruchus chinensis]
MQNMLDGLKRDFQMCWPQLLAIAVGCLGTLNTGFQYAWTSPYIVQITQDKANYDISEDEASYFAVIPPLAMMLTCPVSSYITSTIGPKKGFLLTTIPNLLNWILIATAKQAYVFYIARIFVGISDGIMFTSFPAYIGEISTPKVRGTFGNGPTLAIYLGEFLINLIGMHLTAKQSSYVCSTIPVLFGILFPLMPESPYYLLTIGKEEEAKRSLRWFRRKQDIEGPFQQLKADVERQMSEKGTWKELIFIQSNRKALLGGIFLRISQQFSGLQVFAVYTLYIFEKSGTNLDPHMSTITFVAIVLTLNSISCCTSDYLGRKKAYIISLTACTVVLWTIGVYFCIDEFEPQIDLTYFQWLPLAGLITYTIFASFGISIIPSLMLGELFSASIKSKGLSVLISALGLSTTIMYYLFYYLNTTFGMYFPFIFFAICSSISSALSNWLVPETKGLTLEEIQRSLSRKKDEAPA